MEDIIKARINSTAESHGSLGKEIKISPKSHVYFNKAGAEFKFIEESVEVVIEIGKDHSAHLVMCKSDWEALNSGAEIQVDTLKEFKEIFIKK